MVNYILLLGQSHNWLFLIDLNMGLYKRYYIMCSCKVCTNVHTQNQLFYIHRLMLKPKLVIKLCIVSKSFYLSLMYEYYTATPL